MFYIYTIGIYLYVFFIHIAAVFLPKARLWRNGRKNWKQHLQEAFHAKRKTGQTTIWIHCASLGEFEQGRPLMEALKKQDPNFFVLLTFFSPSGYEIRKDYPYADHVAYLPADLPQNARQFLKIVQPQLVVFVKYEFWYNFIGVLQQHKIPVCLIAALFRPQQPFFQWWGGWFFHKIQGFEHFFLQNQASANLLEEYQLKQYTLAGDPRIDRVLNIAAEAKSYPLVASFAGDAPVLMAGSTWPADEALLADLWQNQTVRAAWKLIIAPHEIGHSHLQQIEEKFSGTCIRYSQLSENNANKNTVLIIDNIGMLSALYRYATLAYIGGGFGAGIHNTLEPMAFGLPVLFGPKYQKFAEANENVKNGGAFVVEGLGALEALFLKLQDEDFRAKASTTVKLYLKENQGATEKILGPLQKLLLRH